MPIEHEAKILDIDADAMERLILDKGGQKLGERFLRRHVYDITPGDRSRWIRLRDTGDETTLSVKQITSDAIDGTHEIEVGVDDFATTHALLEALGFTAKSYQENRRTSFVLDGAQVEIDTWPRIPPYLEIEAGSTDEVVRVAGLLGHSEADLTGENTIKIYAGYGIDLNTIPELRF
ncbi:class IV adenylate cyclase [Streptoalloteichus hindustanus]|uniref:Adenylate cyclase, class 2 n=1 Tax=Streptoalloteichus hindustanus TaxID=2017 RepID=A0A1M5F074_STRHI|nr:CYTH domain-containing protein [Streptoalloteichus hindustanus]SHF84611.1 adenylate cyclase, class 2 [Streptoalloteichus hindustanus]